jgi:hypothetical protein
MSRSVPKSTKIPIPIIEAVEHMRRPGGPMDAYPSFSSAVVGNILYSAIFPKRHRLTMDLARLHEADQDLVHDFVLHCLQSGQSLASLLPKPATAAALLKLAREWRDG